MEKRNNNEGEKETGNWEHEPQKDEGRGDEGWGGERE